VFLGATGEETDMRSIHVSVVVHAAPETVYDYAAAPEHLPTWAAGLAESEVTREGEVLRVASPMGEVTVRFAPPNSLGVLDHEVTLPDGMTVLNPMRVVAHPDGAEVVFSVRQLDLTDDELDRDVRRVSADLDRLREIVEEGDSHTSG
jgi:hypothetical protein